MKSLCFLACIFLSTASQASLVGYNCFLPDHITEVNGLLSNTADRDAAFLMLSGMVLVTDSGSMTEDLKYDETQAKIAFLKSLNFETNGLLDLGGLGGRVSIDSISLDSIQCNRTKKKIEFK